MEKLTSGNVLEIMTLELFLLKQKIEFVIAGSRKWGRIRGDRLTVVYVSIRVPITSQVSVHV